MKRTPTLKAKDVITISETIITKQILEYLERRRVFAWRNNTRVLFVGGRPLRFGYPGSSDIIGITKEGRFLAIEVKRRKGVRTDPQILFQKRVRDLGGIAIFAECVEDVQKII